MANPSPQGRSRVEAQSTKSTLSPLQRLAVELAGSGSSHNSLFRKYYKAGHQGQPTITTASAIPPKGPEE